MGSSDIQATSTMTLWTKALGFFFGWSEQRVREWARRYERGLSGDDPGFYHEDTMYYITPLLIPRRLKAILNPPEFNQLISRLQNAFYNLDVSKLPEELRRQPAQPSFFEALSSFDKNRQEAIEKGEWLTLSNVDTFDWDAAKKRVQQILSEYGEALPSDQEA